jgi:hypothetical protein
VEKAVQNNGFPKSFGRKTQPLDAGALWAEMTAREKTEEQEA